MRVLITGHLGYIGTVMVQVFKNAGHFVGGLDTAYFREGVTETSGVVRPDVETLKDIRKVDEGDLAGFDCIVHLAALANDPMGEIAPDVTMQINFEASIHIARLAKSLKVNRFVFASSCSLYGAGSGSDPLTEEASFNPLSSYAVSKVRAELGLRALADDDFTPVYLRNATAYGVSPHQRLDLVLNNLMAWAMTSGCIRVTSDGTPWRPLVHIEDISRAALCAAEAPQEFVHNESFNVGRSDGNYQVCEIAEAVAKEVPSATLEITGEIAGDRRSYRVSFDKILSRLPGYAPQWTIEQGCKEFSRWFGSRSETVTSFQSREYIRLQQLKFLISEKRVSDALYWLSNRASQ